MRSTIEGTITSGAQRKIYGNGKKNTKENYSEEAISDLYGYHGKLPRATNHCNTTVGQNVLSDETKIWGISPATPFFFLLQKHERNFIFPEVIWDGQKILANHTALSRCGASVSKKPKRQT